MQKFRVCLNQTTAISIPMITDLLSRRATGMLNQGLRRSDHGRAVLRKRLLVVIGELLAAYLAVGTAYAQAGNSWLFKSPGGTVSVKIHRAPLTYSVSYRGQPVVADSPLGLDFRNQPSFGELKLAVQHSDAFDTTSVPVWGKLSPIRNRYNEFKLSFVETASPMRVLTLIFRAYEDGVAFRYDLADLGLQNFELTRERTGFRFAGDPVVWATVYPSFHTSSEQHYPRQRLSDLPDGGIVGLPMLVEAGGVYAAIAEADLTDWAGMSLKPTNGGLVANLSPRLDGRGLVAGSPQLSPWRVLMLGATPGALIESSLIENLNPRSAIKDTS
jgi:alpha-glucosidase